MHANKIMFHAKQCKAVKCKNIIFRTKYFNIFHFSFLQMFFNFFPLFSHANFKKVLVEHFKRKNEEKETNERYTTETYSRLSAAWMKKVTTSS